MKNANLLRENYVWKKGFYIKKILSKLVTKLNTVTL